MTIQIAAPATSLGPWRAARQLAELLAAHGFSASFVERPGHTGKLNAHLSNSSRSLLLPLARRRRCLVTLHDVVPRDLRVRATLAPVILRILRRHRVVVHSRHAAGLLRDRGFDDPVGVVPLFHSVTRPTEEARLAERARLVNGRDGNLLVVAGRLRAAKGVDEIVRVAGRSPDTSFVLLGTVADRATALTLRSAPGNVTLVDNPHDDRFSLVLAAADAVLLPRRHSVGETSGPLVMAHALGTPVAMANAGSAPEYRVPGDLVVAADAPLSQFVQEATTTHWQRLEDLTCAQRSDALAAYCAEFERLGWM